MKSKKANTRGELLLSPTRIRKDLYDYVIKTAKNRQLTITAVINECIETHKKVSEQNRIL